MDPPDPMAAALPVIRLFDQLGVSYFIGGSVASSVYGIPRFTHDVDIVAELLLPHSRALAEALQEDYYIDSRAVSDAIRMNQSFNAICLRDMTKLDIYVPRASEWHSAQMLRRRPHSLLEEEPELECFLASPEDVILHKLRWYRMGGGVSDRHWTDVLGVLKVQAGTLDLDYMRRWAEDQRLTDLLVRALDEAGLVPLPA